jgi:aminoglycoside phosphotransferase (APT) family kinase protein
MSRLGPVGPRATPPTKIAEGREAEIFEWDAHTVLRLYRDAGAHDRAERELAAMSAVRGALPCVPIPHGRLDWQGRPGLLMERLDGRGVLAEIQRRPWRVWRLARLCGRVHADVNRLRAPAALPELKALLRRRLEDAPRTPDALRAAALAELARLPDGEALCHGDFQPDNVLLCAAGPAVIDWPHAARGDPCADFARTALMMRVGSLAPGAPWLIRWGQWVGRDLFHRAYVAGYTEAARYDADAVRRWQFVRAVERLADEIPEERADLLREAARLRSSVAPPAAA